MASSSNREEFFASSSSLPSRRYDVFLSFRGEDTRKNFTDHLYSAFDHRGFHTFKDDNRLEKGEDIGSELEKAIEQSRISMVIFSRNYADSRWCLNELLKIMECKSTFRQMVVPVFYDVKPSDVRAQRGRFADAFAEHEERYKGNGMERKVERWRAALAEAADLSGWDLQDMANGYESKFIEKLVENISGKLDLPLLNVTNYPVGIDSRVQHVNRLLTLGSNDVHIVGIWGVGGLGKTTIAKAIYNQLHLKFEGSSFLANVRETSKEPNGLVRLQQQLHNDILRTEKQNIKSVDQGIEVLKKRLWCRRVLVVLDDVDKFEQLNALAIKRDWFHSGSRIIVTTRDESVLKYLEVNEEYVPELLTTNESLQLFNLHAYRKDHPAEDYEELSSRVVGYAGGLPLVLEVLGSFFKVTSVPEWKSALERLKEIPHTQIREKLRISYDSLDDEEDKNLFLDIAFFFVGKDKNWTIGILKGCFRYPETGLGVLFSRCLLTIDGNGRLVMHDMIRDMGRDIPRREYPNESGKRSRLWFHEDVLDVLKNHTGTQAIEGLVLKSDKSNDVQINAQTFAKMNRLRLLELHYVHVSGNYECFSKMMRWLCWIGFPLKSIPSNLFIDEVVALDMSYSNLKRVWKGRKVLNKLKFLRLSHSYHLTETPDLSGCTHLETLLLNDCTSLAAVHPSIECLDKLLILNLENCKDLRKLPLGISKLTTLQNLCVSGCSKLDLPGFKGSSSKSWFSFLPTWPSLVGNPESISRSILGLISITVLRLRNCNLSYVPYELGSLKSLEMLDLEGNDFCTLPDSINHLSRLDELCLNRCSKLQSLPEMPVNLEWVIACDCESLERISIGSDFRRSPFLYIPYSNKLMENNLASYFRNSLFQNQEVCAGRQFWILYPGNALLDCFNQQSVGPVLSFVVPLLPNRKIRGWTLCAFLEDSELVNKNKPSSGAPLGYEVKNKSKGLKRLYDPGFRECPAYLNNHMLLHYQPRGYLELPMEAGDVVEYSVLAIRALKFQVKQCGVNLIYQDDEKDYPSNDKAMIPYDKDYRLTYRGGGTMYFFVLEDDSVDDAVADNEGRESTTTGTSLTAARGATGKRKRDDADKLGDHKLTKVDDNDPSDVGNKSG